MRIALISYEYPPETGFGGIGTYVQQAARMLTARGHHVEVFSGSLDIIKSLKDDCVIVHRIPTVGGRSNFHNAVIDKFIERNNSIRFDIVEGPEFEADSYSIRKLLPNLPHTVKLHTPSFLLGQLFRGKVGITQKIRFILGGIRRGKLSAPYWKYEKEKDLEYQVTQSVPFILHPSIDIARIISQDWGLHKKKFLHLPNPFDPTDNFLNIPPDVKSNSKFITITFIGKLEKRKGILLLANVIPIICKKYPNIIFKFIGASNPSPVQGLNMQEYLENRLKAYINNLEFTGVVPYKELTDHLATSHICIFPSLWENFPNVCLEAMSAARAVIGSCNGGMMDMIDNNNCGLLVNPYDSQSISEAITRYIENPLLRLEHGLKARERVLNCYNKEIIGRKTEEIYQKIIYHWEAYQ